MKDKMTDQNTRRTLDNKYLLVRTIGQGRYAKVKLAIDLKTKKKVAVKILRTT